MATQTYSVAARFGAEVLGTFILVLGGVGTAVFAAGFDTGGALSVNVGFLGVSIAFGLTLIGGIYALGPVSGGHFNPAVSLGLAAAGRFQWKDTWWYIVAQTIGGAIASSVLYLIAIGRPDHDLGNFAANGFDSASPGGYGLWSVSFSEVIMTMVFVGVVIGATSKRAAAGFAPIAIGVTLTLVHLISIPISNTSVNPARSFASAIYGGGLAWEQLWVFVLFPIVGALIVGWTCGPILSAREDKAAA